MTDWHHVYPVGDVIEHTIDGEYCECHPTLNFTDMIVIHNALDNREFDEIANEINSDE